METDHPLQLFRDVVCTVQLLLEFQGLAQECEGDSAVLSQRIKSLSTELQGVVEKQLQVGAVLTRMICDYRKCSGETASG